MYLIKDTQNPDYTTVKPRYSATAGNYQGTGYTAMLTVSNASGWFLSAFQSVEDDDGMTGYIRIDIDGVTKINDMVLFNTAEYSGVVRNLVCPLRFENSLIVYHRVAAANTGVGTSVFYDLD